MDNNDNNEKIETLLQRIARLIKPLYVSVSQLISEVLSVRQGADIPGTTENIKNDIEFKGYNIWILIFSIFIASIGLNTNSVAIIVGAMLISPLMGPILGLGLSLGTNDIPLLQKSAKNIVVAVVVSILTSYIYFKLTPFQDERSEILSRTRPQLFDVLISIFGGLAGIIGSSRKIRSNVIPGVAIATALMPPLCTAGYGLAMGRYEYFLGAFYLFLLNAAGISITTLIVVRYMGFPKVSYLDKKKEKRAKWMISLFWFALIIPSGFMFYSVLREDLFQKNVKTFLCDELKYEHSFLVKNEVNYMSDSTSTIKLYFYGDILDSIEIKRLRSELLKLGVENTDLVLYQGKDQEENFSHKITNVESSYQNLIERTNHSIALQNAKIDNLNQKINVYVDSISVVKLNEEIKIIFPQIENVAFGKMTFLSDSNTAEVIPTFRINVRSKIKRSPSLDKSRVNE